MPRKRFTSEQIISKPRELKKENGRMKKLVTNMALDKDILREAASANF